MAYPTGRNIIEQLLQSFRQFALLQFAECQFLQNGAVVILADIGFFSAVPSCDRYAVQEWKADRWTLPGVSVLIGVTGSTWTFRSRNI